MRRGNWCVWSGAANLCLECDTGFESDWDLIAHGQTCRGRKRFKCLICSEDFDEWNRLARHWAGHSTYSSPDSPKQFKEGTTLKEVKSHPQQHLESNRDLIEDIVDRVIDVTADDTKLRCRKCKRRLSDEASMRSHDLLCRVEDHSGLSPAIKKEFFEIPPVAAAAETSTEETAAFNENQMPDYAEFVKGRFTPMENIVSHEVPPPPTSDFVDGKHLTTQGNASPETPPPPTSEFVEDNHFTTMRNAGLEAQLPSPSTCLSDEPIEKRQPFVVPLRSLKKIQKKQFVCDFPNCEKDFTLKWSLDWHKKKQHPREGTKPKC